MSSPTQGNCPQDNTTVKALPGKGSRRKSRQVICQICHEAFKELTADHLRSHGFTTTRYRRAYQTNTRAPRGSSPSTDDPRLTVLDLAQRIVTDPQVIRDLAGEVAEAIFSTSLRDQLRLALVSLLAQRLDSHGKATSALDEVRAELTARWRIAQGGLNGAPTPTKELVQIGQLLQQEVKQSEDLLSKTVKLAIDEFKNQQDGGAIGGGLHPDRFTGSGEALPIPASLTPGDREAIRTLYGMFDKAIVAKRTLNAEVVSSGPSVPADVLPATQPQAPDRPEGNPEIPPSPDDEHSVLGADVPGPDYDEPF